MRLAANFIFPISSAPIKNGYVDFAEDGSIKEIGQLDKETPDTAFYNGIIVPGFTNAHCHIELSHLKGKFKEATGMSGFIDQINALRESAPQHQRLAAMQAEYDRLYKEGVSAIGDISNCNESFAMKASSPIHSRTYIEVFGSEPQDAEHVIADAKMLLSEARQAGLDATITPHSPYTMSPKLLTMAAAEGLKDGYISYHNQESQEEDDMIGAGKGALYENYKKRSLSTPTPTGQPAIFHFMDCLSEVHKAPFNESILLVHNTVTTEKCIDAAEESFKNCTWVTCPLSNIFIHRKMANLNLLQRKGVRVAIGTDSLSSNHILSMVEEFKCIQKHFPSISLETILRWACLNGATALGKNDILGSFEIGKKPGAVLIDNIDFSTMSLTAGSRSRRLV